MGRLSARLGIEAPIIQSGMRGVAGPELAAAVSNAGGLGILAGLLASPDSLRDDIRTIRSLTDRPFGVNLWLHDQLRPPTPPEAVDPDVLGEVQGALNAIRARHGLASVDDAPGPIPDLLRDAVEVLLDESVPVFSAGLGIPDADLVERFHAAGATVIAMVTSSGDALMAVDRGVDVVVAQGSEAGGHRSVGSKPDSSSSAGSSSMTLIPGVRDAVGGDVPVVAAGGIADGRGLAAAIMLGADGVLLGTRFVATRESLAHPAWKQELLDHSRPTVLTDAFTGLWARALRNDFTETYRRTTSATLPSLLQASASGDIVAHAHTAGEPELLPMWAGDSATLVGDVPDAASVVHRLADEASRLLGRDVRDH